MTKHEANKYHLGAAWRATHVCAGDGLQFWWHELNVPCSFTSSQNEPAAKPRALEGNLASEASLEKNGEIVRNGICTQRFLGPFVSRENGSICVSKEYGTIPAQRYYKTTTSHREREK